MALCAPAPQGLSSVAFRKPSVVMFGEDLPDRFWELQALAVGFGKLANRTRTCDDAQHG